MVNVHRQKNATQKYNNNKNPKNQTEQIEGEKNNGNNRKYELDSKHKCYNRIRHQTCSNIGHG